MGNLSILSYQWDYARLAICSSFFLSCLHWQPYQASRRLSLSLHRMPPQTVDSRLWLTCKLFEFCPGNSHMKPSDLGFRISPLGSDSRSFVNVFWGPIHANGDWTSSISLASPHFSFFSLLKGSSQQIPNNYLSRPATVVNSYAL